MTTTNKSYSSFDTNDFIDLDTALVEEELRSLGSTPEHAHRDYTATSRSPFKFSLKSIDEKQTERFRRSLVTPLSRYNTPEWRSRSKSPTGSYAESVALFKNLSNNNDHLDLVTSDFNDFMDSYDDDLMSRPGSQQQFKDIQKTEEVYQYHRQPSTTPFLQILSQRKSREKLTTSRYTETPPEISSFDASVQTAEVKAKKSNPSLTQRRQSTVKLNDTSRLHKDMERLTINKRQSVDLDALKKLKEQQLKREEMKLKRHTTLASSRSRLTDTKLKSSSLLQPKLNNNVPQKSTINNATTTQRVAQRTSLLQPLEKRRWSSYVPEDPEYAQREKKASQRETEQPSVLTKPTRLVRTEQSRAEPQQQPVSYTRRHHMLPNGSSQPSPSILKEEPLPKHRETRLTSHIEDRYHSESLSSRQYAPPKVADTTNKQRRHIPQESPIVYHDDESDIRRPRTLSNPSRYRKLSNNSKKEEYKEVRFHPEEIVASRSSGLLSSSTTSSSHSGDLYYDPPSPPAKTNLVKKRRSMVDIHLTDERTTENRYSQYLQRIKKETYIPKEQEKEEEDEEEEDLTYAPRRQRVVSEDNEGYKYQSSSRRKSLYQQQPLSPSQIPVNTTSTMARNKERRLYRASSTEDVTESARKVLALVQQRRNNSAANKSVLQQLPSNYPRRRDIYYH